MESRVRLLMRDGAASVYFRSTLTVEQYDELLREIETPATIAELRVALAQLAVDWGSEVEIDDV
jgi:hypothetical protein